MRPMLPFFAALLIAAPLGAQTMPVPADQAAIRADVAALADDAMRGREAGTPDYDRAAAYIAARMRAAGLRQGAGGGWFQPVPLVSSQARTRPVLVLTRGDRAERLLPCADYAAGALPGRAAATIQGPLVFAGHGVVDPVSGRDDFRGLDLRGAIVVMLQSRPTGFAPAVAAHLGNPRQRARLAAARGARGVIFVASTADAAGFSRLAEAQWQARRMTWRGRDEGAPALATLSPAGAAKLFADGPLSLPAIIAAEASGAAIPTGALPGHIRVTIDARREPRRSANVVGLLPGSDPRLAKEYVVLSAHADHLGIVPGPDGSDRIANGAQDNAIGVALMLEVARLMQAQGIRPRRSILFVALTGEEKGLLGSDYLAQHPPVTTGAIVADVNLDMPVLLAPLRDVVVHGGDRSTLGPLAQAAANAVDLPVAPDWEPEQGRFARSDQYSFAIAGIPAISLKSGPSGGSAELQRQFAQTRYHTPADDLAHPIFWPAAPIFARLNLAILRAIADADARPAWNPGDFYGRLAAEK